MGKNSFWQKGGGARNLYSIPIFAHADFWVKNWLRWAYDFSELKDKTLPIYAHLISYR